MKKILISVGLVFMLSACGNDHIIRFNLSPQHDDNVEAKPQYKGRSHFFLWGMYQKTDYDLINACRSRGINAIEAHWNWWDSLMGGLTMGVYAPESFSVYCN